MARLFSWGPPLRIRGRKLKGLRGFAGKPFHPPLTDIPIACYALTAVFDGISVIYYAGDETSRPATDFFRAATFVIVAGTIASVPTRSLQPRAGQSGSSLRSSFRSLPSARGRARRRAKSRAVAC